MVVQELIAKLGFDVDSSGLNKADQGLASLASGALKAVGAIYLAKKAMDALVWGVVGSVEAASRKEDVTTQFKVLLGDLETAKYLYQEVNQYAAVSPFETAGLSENLKTLIAMGMSAKSAFGDLKMLGDVALGDQNKLNRMALTYGQVMSLGRLQGDNLREFALQGWNPLTYWQAKSGKSMEQLRKDMEKGLISAAMVQEALQAATAQGGKFYKGAEEGSKTWSGMMSTMQDNIQMLGAELGEMLLPFLKEVLKAFFALWPAIVGAWRGLGQFFGILFRDGPKAVTWAEMIAGAFRGVAYTLEFIALVWQGLVVAFEVGASAIALVGSVIWDALKSIGYVVSLVFRDLFKGIQAVGETLGITKLEKFGRTNAEELQAMGDDYEFMGTTKGAWGQSSEDVGNAVGKYFDMAAAFGQDGKDPGKIKLTDRMDKIMSGMAAKQPITNITQNNNLTVNAEDPIKSMGEAAATKFFQGAFIQIRHATV
jgi:tape measure domain-containing protein